MKGYRNQIRHDDVLNVLRALPDDSVDMVYGDPDYGVGIDYAGQKFNMKFGDYIAWYVELAKESLRVLKPNGNLFFINYPKQNAWLRVQYLDEAAHDVFDYAWIYNTNVGHSKRRFTTAHRSILHATKTADNQFYKNNVALPYQNPEDKRIRARIERGEKGRMPYSWFYFDLVKNVSKDKTFHACQIPLELAKMLIMSCTQKNDDCFILFGGSGSELLLCRALERNFLSCEIHPDYYAMILDRLAHDGAIKAHFRLPFRQKQTNADADVDILGGSGDAC